MKRKIIKIDEAKCNGCGECVPSCAEGAIRIVDGKAKLITCLDDVLDELLEVGEIMRSYSADDNDGKRAGDDEPSVPVHLLPNEQAVFAAVKSGEEDVDSIVQASGLNVARVTSLLTTLQLKGLTTPSPVTTTRRFMEDRC